MPAVNKNDPRGDNRTKGKVSKYGQSAAGDLGADVLLPVDSSREVVACINAVMDAGDGIMFRRTSGGGILAITVYSEGCEPARLYAKGEEQALDILADIENTARG